MPQAYIRTVCFVNYTSSQKNEFKADLNSAVQTYYGWLSLPVALFALLLSSLYCIVVYQAIRSRRVSRKCYVLLLNRTIGDIICCLAALIAALYVLTTRHPNFDVVTIFENFFMASFWSAMVSYVSLSTIKLYAVWQPLHYRKIFIMRRCIYLALFSWLIFGLILFFTLLVAALVKMPSLNKWSGCRLETCLRLVYVVRHCIVVALYFFTIFAFVLTVILIKRAERFAKKYSKGSLDKAEQRSRFPLWKLTCNMATFAGLTVFYILWSIYLLIQTEPCFFLKNIVEMTKMIGFVRCALMFRIQVDPIISFIADYQIRRSLIRCFGLERKLTSGSARGFFRKSSEGAYNSSFAQPHRDRRRSTDAANKPSEKVNELM